MRSTFTKCRTRLAASMTALLGLSTVSGCQQEPAPGPAAPDPTYAPSPVAAPTTPPPGTVTTLAIGEEDGGYTQPVPSEPTVTTLAVGEEDGGGPIPVEPDGGIGDGAGPPAFDGSSTTYEIGEEDDVKIFIPPEPNSAAVSPNYGQATTLAIGEEG